MPKIWKTLALPILSCAVLSACSGGGDPGKGGAPGMRALAVRTAPVVARDVVYRISSLGSLEPDEMVQITAEVTGAVKEVMFDAGDRVTVETILARIDPERYRLEAVRADAAYRRAVADWKRSESDLARREELAKDQLVAVEELNRVRQETERLSADAAAAKAALEIAQQNARRADVRAPHAGEINTRTVDTGQFVQVGTVLATLVDLRRLRLRFKVSESESLKAKEGQTVAFRVGSLGDTEFTAKVYHVGDVADPATRQVEILAWVDNPGVLKPGFFAEVTLATETRTGAIVINEGAVQASERGFVVFVVADGKAQERPVKLGLRTGDGAVEIVSGLSLGETIVTEGSDRLGNGMAVQDARSDSDSGGRGVTMADRPRTPEPPEDPRKIATGMTLADISIRNHVFAWILMIALIGFGILCYTGAGSVFRGLGISQNPDVDYPIVNVGVSWQGASPEIMETDVVDPLEDALSTVEGVKEMSSTARQGSASVTLEFEIDRNIDAALQDVQTKVSRATHDLPREIDPPTISKTNPEDQPIIRLALSGDRPATFLADYVRNVIRPQLQMIEGVGAIDVFGFRDRNVRVWYDATRLEALGLTVLDVNGAIAREHQEVPAGRIEGVEREMNVRAQGEAIDISSFRDLVITYKDGAPVRLKDVAVVEDGLEDRRRLNRNMGETSIGFAITKLRGANAVQVGRDVKAKMDVLAAQLPEGMRLNVNWDTTTFIERSIREILFTLLLAALLTGFVCWLFLGSWSTTVNILLAIPTSIFGTFIVIYAFGFTLNTYTVLGLTLVVGIVVDDAIMVLENIYRHREMGQGKVKAASVGAREITFAAAATTMAIIAIFLPVAFMKGIIGKFFFQFGVTISVAVALSLLEALTLAPMRCSRFLEVEHRGRLGRTMDELFKRLSRLYLRALEPALHHRVWVLAGSFALFVASLGIIGLLRQEFIPSQDMSRFTIRFTTPVGTSLDVTDRYFRQVESFLMARLEVLLFAGSVGGGADVNSGMAFVNMKEPGERPIDPARGRALTQLEFMDVVRRHAAGIPGGRIVLQDISQTGFSPSRGGGYPIEFNVRGPDWNVLAASAREIAEQLRGSGVVTDVDTDYRVGMPEVQVLPDRNKAADLGVSMAAIGETVNAAIGGVRVGKFKDKGRRFDIRGRLLAQQRERPEDIERLLVRTAGGELVRLGELIRIRQEPTLQAITRRDRERAITIYANVATGVSQTVAVDRSLAIARSVLPDGYRAVVSGSTKAFRESFQSLWFAFGLGLLIAYMVLASQFNSFWHPVVILLALPFSVSGALLALLLGGQSLNVYSMLGLILLVGIAKKNSIMLVDFTNQFRERGVDRHQALLQACPIRLRPILMTSTATIAGALPPAFAIGPGAELQRPMALALVGGMVVSTLLTLFVVPAGYSVLDDVIEWWRARRRERAELAVQLGPAGSDR